MSEELAKQDNTPASLAEIAAIAGGGIQKFDDTAFEKMSKSGDYLCRMQLCGSNSKLFKKNLIKKGNYAYVVSENNFSDLGDSVDILPICWRPKAIDMSGDTPMSFYDINSQAFKDVCTKSFTSNSECSYGPDFLVWIPSIKKFATLLFGSKTARKDAPDLQKLLAEHKPATLTHRVIDGGKFIWEAITVSPCSTPFENMPTKEELIAHIEKFNLEATAKAPEKVEQSNRAR